MGDKWTVQTNDAIGGYIITDYPHPVSEFDFRPNGDPTKRGTIACECSDEWWAHKIVILINNAENDGLL